jgi:hypothetical protein
MEVLQSTKVLQCSPDPRNKTEHVLLIKTQRKLNKAQNIVPAIGLGFQVPTFCIN